MRKNKQKAFTLAEVLITLGIIGVVAALTIPTLIADYQKRDTVAKLQKAISVLNNGMRLMMADEGIENWSQAKVNNECYKGPVENGNACAYNYYSKYFKIASYPKNDNDTDYYVQKIKLSPQSNSESTSGNMLFAPHFQTQDGIMFWPFYRGPVFAIVDINGKAEPNQYGRDIFELEMENGYYNAYGEDTWNDPSAYGYCGNQTHPANRPASACSGRIKAEGWKINY